MTKPTILVVEDDADILELLSYNLAREGFQVNGAKTGEEGIHLARRRQPVLVLLDVMLPGMDGLEVCRSLKRDPATESIPVIMLTAKGEEADVVVGLELGADDYIIKPFSPRVVAARVRAVLRRKARSSRDDAESIVTVHGVTVHPGRREVLVRGAAVQLTPTEFDILRLLAGRPGWVYTRRQIVDQVRGYEHHVTERAVDVHILALRRKLDAAGKYLETVHGVGYRFKE